MTDKPKNKPSDYTWIEKWGKMMGSGRDYIKSEQRDAARDGAPVTAIYKREGVWKTVDSVSNKATRLLLGLPPLSEGQ